jgi:hypothetical protein
MSLEWLQRGFPAHVVWLPIGSGVFRPWGNGADTEVRAPATLVLGPCGGVIWMGADWIFGPRGLAAHWYGGLPTIAQRSGHRGPPPRDAGSGPLRRGEWMDADWIIGPHDLAAHWGGGPSAMAQRRGHGGPRSRDAVVEQACQPVRQRIVDEQHDEVSGRLVVVHEGGKMRQATPPLD